MVPSLFKSPIPTAFQALDRVPSAVPPTMWPFWISQVSTCAVVVFFHKTTVVRSHLKVPTPHDCQARWPTPRRVPPLMCPFVMSQLSTAPVVVFCHITSAVPS